MAVTTIPQISDVLDQHSVRITTAQTTADFAESEAARALTSIYDVDLDAKTYTDAEIQKLKDMLRAEFAAADGSINTTLDAAIDSKISAALPTLLNSYYGNYAGMQALYDQLLVRFGQSDAALDHLLNTVVPGLQQNVDTLDLTASSVAQDFSALEQSLKSVLIVFADDAAGTNQSLTADGREYVRYVEYNGTPPTLPVTGTFTKFVGTAQSVWPIYASTAGGNDQSFEPGSRTYVTFYESPVAPDLPVSGETFVRYVGSDGSSGERGAGVWYVSVSSLPSTASTSAQNAWNTAVSQGQDIPTRPKPQDQVYFYTGSAGNPSGQRVFICQWATSDTSHGWYYQENVMRGDLLVPGTVTANEINSRGLTILDEAGNVILQATGGSAGINLSKVIGAGNFAALNQITSANVGTYIGSAAISDAYIGSLSAAKITAGTFDPNRIPSLDQSKITNLATDLSAISATANSKIRSFYQSSTPSATGAGDLWYNSSNNYVYRAAAAGTGSWSRVSIQADSIVTNWLGAQTIDVTQLNGNILNTSALNIDGVTLTQQNGNLIIKSGGVATDQLGTNAATKMLVTSQPGETTTYAPGLATSFIGTNWITPGSGATVLCMFYFRVWAGSTDGTASAKVRLRYDNSTKREMTVTALGHGGTPTNGVNAPLHTMMWATTVNDNLGHYFTVEFLNSGYLVNQPQMVIFSRIR